MTSERAPDVGCCTDLARRADPDRFLTILAAPSRLRAALCAVIALNHELVRATELPSARSGAGPIAGLIRLQWWRDVIENSRPDWHNQPVAVSVRALLDTGQVRQHTLLTLLAAREAEADGLPTITDWQTAMLDGAGGLQRALGEVLGVGPTHADRLAAAGAAYGCGALRRHLPAALAAGRIALPEPLTRQPLPAQRAFLAGQGALFLKSADGPRLPRGQGSALLPLVLARRDLRRDDIGARGLGDRLAVLVASINT